MDNKIHHPVNSCNTVWGIHQRPELQHNFGMGKINQKLLETRQRRLLKAIEILDGGSQVKFAERVSKKPSAISDMLSGRKSFGEKVVRDLEAKTKLGYGWFDTDEFIPVEADQDYVKKFERAYAIASKDSRLSLEALVDAILRHHDSISPDMPRIGYQEQDRH